MRQVLSHLPFKLASEKYSAEYTFNLKFKKMENLLMIDKYTGEQCRYVQTDVWYDNITTMDDTKCDHVIYIQHEHKYYKRVLNNYITVKMFGAIGDGITDDSSAIQKAVDFCEKTSQKTLFFPPGNYLLNTPIENSRGGIKFMGAGALLREESLWPIWTNSAEPHSPFSGCSLIVPKNSSAFVFKSTVTDPVYVEAIQFLAKEGRQTGSTFAIDFKSEFDGPTWPFVVRDCHFRGFNRAINFKSATPYNVAFVQITGCAFSQNDECVYFDFANDNERNLAWGFHFENNKCHDNSRVIYGSFAKDLVRIIDNNFEGSIPYSKNDLPPSPLDIDNPLPTYNHYSIDIEIDNAVVQFFGNHFESMRNHAVSISSLRKDINNNYLDFSGSTALSNRNKVEIFGNNMDGMFNKNQIKFNLSGVQIINKDDVSLHVHACEIIENNSVSPNIFLNPKAKLDGTVIKFSDIDGSAYLFNSTLENYEYKKLPVTPRALLIDGEQYESKGNKNPSDIHFHGGYTFAFHSKPKYLGASFKVKSRHDIFTANVFFNIFYLQGSNTISQPPINVAGALFSKGGDSVIVAIIPNNDYYSDTSDLNVFTAGLNIDNLEKSNILVANDITYFTVDDDNPKILPYYEKSNLVEKTGTFEKGQTFSDVAGDFNVVKQSGTISNGDFLTGVEITGSAGENFITTNQPQKLTIGQYLEIPNATAAYRITGCKDGNTFYLNKALPSSFNNHPCTFSAPFITVI